MLPESHGSLVRFDSTGGFIADAVITAEAFNSTVLEDHLPVSGWLPASAMALYY